VSACSSVTSGYCIKTDERVDMVFFRGGFCPPLLHRAIKKFKCLKIWALPSGTLSESLDVENFTTSRRSSQRVVNKGGRLGRVAGVWAKWLTARSTALSQGT